MHLIPHLTSWLVLLMYIENDAVAQTLKDGVLPGLGRHGGRFNNMAHFRICGAALNDLLVVVCDGIYGGPNPSKNTVTKKADETATQYDDGWINPDDNYAIYPFRSRRSAMAFGSDVAFRRKSRGIVDECCYNECTLANIKRYCGR